MCDKIDNRFTCTTCGKKYSKQYCYKETEGKCPKCSQPILQELYSKRAKGLPESFEVSPGRVNRGGCY